MTNDSVTATEQLSNTSCLLISAWLELMLAVQDRTSKERVVLASRLFDKPFNHAPSIAGPDACSQLPFGPLLLTSVPFLSFRIGFLPDRLPLTKALATKDAWSLPTEITTFNRTEGRGYMAGKPKAIIWVL